MGQNHFSSGVYFQRLLCYFEKMRQLISLIFIAIGFGTILFLHLFGMSGWYYSVKFYDKFIHFLAGIFGSALIFFLLFKLAAKGPIKIPRIFYSAFVFTTVVTIGVGWEFFEFFFLPQFQLGLSDTLFDLFWIGVGSVLTNIVFYENFRH